MDTVIDMIPSGETVLPIKANNAIPVDLLGRQEIVDRIIKILEVISEKKSSCTFALNGAWGTGKTFILNMLMNQLWECNSDKYIVFHYNCWQYDYYEEPLIAIIAAMLDSVDEENHLFSVNVRDNAKAGMALAKPILKRILIDIVKNKIGVDLTDVVSSMKDSIENYQEALNSVEQDRAESRSFDEFYSFRKAIQQAQNEIRILTMDRTLVVVVDELDRCLPCYAIKVLERLHHLFFGISNTAVVLGVDKTQIDQTVKQIFGDKTDTSHYLRKFINFSIDLHIGFIDKGNLQHKYEELFKMFYRPFQLQSFPIEEFIASLLSDIPIRIQEQIINKINTVNHLILHNDHFDESILCGELLWVILAEVYECYDKSPFVYDHGLDRNREPGFKLNINKENRFTYFFDKYWSYHFIDIQSQYVFTDSRKILQGNGEMQKLLVYYLSEIYADINGEEGPFGIALDDDPFNYLDYDKNLTILKDAIDLLRTIN